ncbi:MAG: hypothetical protein H0X37_02990 [Herpetosiphonaceae bacterium]|nr:hypothetical protein [Herpetosiphonaceae bacterium]
MHDFESRLRSLLAAVRRDPLDVGLSTTLSGWIDEHPGEFGAFLPAEALSFRNAPDREERRIRFLKHLLLHGYMPPRVEQVSGSAWQTRTINLAVSTSYFYPNALSLLEAGLGREDVAVFVVSPQPLGDASWIEAVSSLGHQRVQLQAALMLDEDGLVWRQFEEPVPVHYLFPVDNYYRDKFRLVGEYGQWRVPMPGSQLIREVCENKLLLVDIVSGIPGLHLAHELQLAPTTGETAWIMALDDFSARYQLAELVTKPVDGFGGSGVEFWRYPQDRPALIAWLREAFATTPMILVQGRIRPVPTRSGREWNLRQYVLRNGPEAVLAPWKRVRIGHGVINITRGAGSSTTSTLLEDLALEPEQLRAFEAALQSTDALAVAVLHSLEAYLVRHWGATEQLYHGLGSNLSADLLALDFMIAPDPARSGTYAVYLNEINDFASGGMRDYELLYHREARPDADHITATESFALAPHILTLAKWRGGAYQAALERLRPA